MEFLEQIKNNAPIIISILALFISIYSTYVSTSSNYKIAKQNRKFSYLNNKLSELREAEKKLGSAHDSILMKAKETRDAQLVIQFHNHQLEIFSDVALYLPSDNRDKLESIKQEIIDLGEHLNKTGVTEMPESLSNLIYDQFFKTIWSAIDKEVKAGSSQLRALHSDVSKNEM